jgi:hypothetical protein
VGSIETRVSTAETAHLTVLRSLTVISDDLTTAGVGPEAENMGAVISQNAIVMGYRISLVDAFDKWRWCVAHP